MKASGGVWREARQWARDLMIASVAAVFIILFLYQPVRVEGGSMQPRLESRDRLFINKMAYRLGPVKRGDVVVFHAPGEPEKSYIKRVIGVGGDVVRVEHGTVMVNGVAVAEPYVPEEYRDERSTAEVRVPAGEVFVMGDHRTISSDSRDFGPVAAASVYGKAEFVYWPVGELGTVR